MTSGGGRTVRAKVPDFETPALSVTVIVKLTVPSAGGVPVKTPPLLRLKNAGKPAADHAKTPLPPVAAIVTE